MLHLGQFVLALYLFYPVISVKMTITALFNNSLNAIFIDK